MHADLPLVFACSGCSEAGQLANRVALELSRRGAAEMSCLAGVGAEKPPFLKQLRSREVWVVDGCPIECALGVFQRIARYVDVTIRLHEFGVRKRDPPLDEQQFAALIEQVLHYARSQREPPGYDPTPA